ncbi:hypothetical protein [Croceicoccus naphthovorans]|nr:hypothetical protein [Croceicoccus naphthovorans]
MNFHNQGLARADYQGARGQGFTVEFLAEKAARDMEAGLQQGAVAIRSSSIEAAVTSTDEIKQKMRSFLDAHFTGSEMHGNNHRRVSNASVQSVTYDDVSEKGQFTSLIYSKFGYRGGGGFVDFLLLHMRGGTVKPQKGEWIRLDRRGKGQIGQQTGFFPLSKRDTFFVEADDGKKLFQLRRKRGGGPAAKGTELLATLVRSLTFKPSLQGLETIMATRGAVFERHFDALLGQRLSQSGGQV